GLRAARGPHDRHPVPVPGLARRHSGNEPRATKCLDYRRDQRVRDTLSDQLVAAWTNFAATGNPNWSGNSPWPRYVDQEGVPEYLSENVPSLSTFTNAEF